MQICFVLSWPQEMSWWWYRMRASTSSKPVLAHMWALLRLIYLFIYWDIRLIAPFIISWSRPPLYSSLTTLEERRFCAKYNSGRFPLNEWLSDPPRWPHSSSFWSSPFTLVLVLAGGHVSKVMNFLPPKFTVSVTNCEDPSRVIYLILPPLVHKRIWPPHPPFQTDGKWMIIKENEKNEMRQHLNYLSFKLTYKCVFMDVVLLAWII